MRYWAWVVGGINAALIVVWANVLPGLKDFLDYMGSTSTSAINLLEQQVSISNPILNPPEISRLAEQTIEEQVSISNPISTPPEIQSVDRSLVISN
ncbi:MAG: hypothetical protein RL728_1197 [Bacteroidota bacterium]|jgi:hypothetical protein